MMGIGGVQVLQVKLGHMYITGTEFIVTREIKESSQNGVNGFLRGFLIY